MKFNLAAVLFAAVTFLAMVISVNIGPGFSDGPFRISGISYGVLSSIITGFILTRFIWWGSVLPVLSCIVTNAIIVFFKFKEESNVYI
jgi:hypothetical protein